MLLTRNGIVHEKLTNGDFRERNSGVTKFRKCEDEIVAEEEDERERDEDAPTELVVDAQLAVQHEVQVVEERRKAWKVVSTIRISV